MFILLENILPVIESVYGSSTQFQKIQIFSSDEALTA